MVMEARISQETLKRLIRSTLKKAAYSTPVFCLFRLFLMSITKKSASAK